MLKVLNPPRAEVEIGPCSLHALSSEQLHTTLIFSLLFTAGSNVTLHVRMTLVPTYSGPVGLTLTTTSGLGTERGGRERGGIYIGRESERVGEIGEKHMN